jgi:riboflavin synthase
MFSGIIYDLAKVKSATNKSGLKEVVVALTKDIISPQKGMSIAVNGVCLTAVSIKGKKEFTAEATAETSAKSTIKNLKTGDYVNIEFPVTPSTLLSGHMVQGHVDAAGRVASMVKKGRDAVLEIDFPPKFGKLIVEKGSIAVDGVSLTAFDVRSGSFKVAVIPETLGSTIIEKYARGREVNLEFDIIGKYILKQQGLDFKL